MSLPPSQVQVLQLRHARQVTEAIVGELTRAAEREAGDVIEVGDALEHRIGQQPVGVQRLDAAILHDADEVVPLGVAQLPPWRDPVVGRVDVESLDGWRAGRHRVRQRDPAAETSVLRDKRLRLDQLKIVPGDS